MEERIYKVYMHTSPNDKVYIGITMQDVNKRWQNGKAYNHNNYFNSSIKKYGWNNFKHEILLCNLTKEEANILERIVIKYYKSNNIKYGYNIQEGGNVNGKMPKSVRDKISKAHLGKNKSDKTRKNMSESKKGCIPWNKGKKYKTGYICPEETKEKIRKAMIGIKRKPITIEHKIKISKSVINIDTLEIFMSISDAIRKYGGDIGRAVKNKSKAKGSRWMYYDEYILNNCNE